MSDVKPKIVLYTTILSATGGGQHAMSLLACELVRRGYEIHFVTRPPFDPDHEYVRWLRRAGANFSILPRFDAIPAVQFLMRLAAVALFLPYLILRRTALSVAWTAAVSIVSTRVARLERAWIERRLAAACRSDDRNVILHVWGPAALTPMLLEWAERHAVPALYHEMGEADESYVRTWALEATIASIGKAAKVICCSESVARCVRSVYRYRGPVSTIPFMTAEPREIEPRRDRPFTIGTIGRLVPHKRHGELIHAVRRLRDEGVDVRLFVAGSGPTRPELERLCAELDVVDRVEFFGAFDDLADVMSRFDVFALTSSSESQCMPITESMAYGKPAVVSAVGGMPDFVEDGVTGFVVTLGDIDQLVSALRRLSDDPSLLDRMRRTARKRYAERFRPDAVTAAIELAYADVLAAADSPSRRVNSLEQCAS